MASRGPSSRLNIPGSEYVNPTAYIDSDHPRVQAFAETAVADAPGDVDRARRLYLAVRDGFRYDPYRIDLSPAAMRASAVLERGYGFCIPKAVLLAAAARSVGIPTRLRFGDVHNHLNTERLRRLVGSDVFVYHGLTELYLRGRWVKATPAFNASLCERFGVAPLEFDGIHDSMFQEYNREGRRHMEYVRDRGHFADLPLDAIRDAFTHHYPRMVSGGLPADTGAFEEDALREG